MFKPNELVGFAEGDDAVQLRIVSISDDNNIITAQVVKLGNFFSSKRLKEPGSRGFVLNEYLVLEKNKRSNIYVIILPSTRPWHDLYENKDGSKGFKYYK